MELALARVISDGDGSSVSVLVVDNATNVIYEYWRVTSWKRIKRLASDM